MSNAGWLGTLRYLGSIIVAMCLKVIPWWSAIQAWNPDWVLLVLIYWVLASPYKYGIFNAWAVGLLVDVLTGQPLGQYALIYALVSYVCLKFYRRILHFPFLQQALFIFCCLLGAQIISFTIDNIYHLTQFQWVFLSPAITGALIWPVAGLILRGIHFNPRVR